MVISKNSIKNFELTKNFNKEVRNYIQNNNNLEEKIIDRIYDFQKIFLIQKFIENL